MNAPLQIAISEQDSSLRTSYAPWIISLSPLRERSDMIGALLRSLIHASSNKASQRIHYIEAEVVERLKRYHWPGKDMQGIPTVFLRQVLAFIKVTPSY